MVVATWEVNVVGLVVVGAVVEGVEADAEVKAAEVGDVVSAAAEVVCAGLDWGVVVGVDEVVGLVEVGASVLD
jgi:hypothetical protein